jgi:hypothetical protein
MEHCPLCLAQQPPVDQSLLIHEVSRSQTTTHHSRWGFSGWMISSSQRPLPGNTQHSQETDFYIPCGIRTHIVSRRAAADLRLRLRGTWDWHHCPYCTKFLSTNYLSSLRCGSAAAHLLGLRIRFPQGAWTSVYCFMYCQVEVSASGWLLFQKSPTECGVSQCDREASIVKRPWPSGVVARWRGEYLFTAARSGSWVLVLMLKPAIGFLPGQVLFCSDIHYLAYAYSPLRAFFL